MKNLIKLFAIIIILTLTSFASANRMQPLASERLNNPIELDCGIFIKEWRGGKKDIKLVNKLCSKSLDYYPAFLKKHNLKRKHTWIFRFSMALVPDGRCSRCMNDLDDRFVERPQQSILIGYTSANQRWTYLIGDTYHPEFKVTFVHELFHALNVFYGLWTPTEAEEDLAEAFTYDLGLGK